MSSQIETFHQTHPLEDSVIEQFLEKKLGVKPLSVRSPPEIWAEYHKIYIATFADQVDVFLRVSKPAIPEWKTRNEVACITWVRQHIKTCPAPEIIAWSASTDELGFEYVLLRRLPGRDLGAIYKDLTNDDITNVIRQVADMFIAMAKLPFDKIGGLTISDDGMIKPGPVIEETTYEMDNFEQLWGADYASVTFEQLQIGGPFDTVTAYFKARLQRDLFVLMTHRRCADLRITFEPDVRVLLNSFTDTVQKHLEDRSLIMAHQDLHLGNLLWDQRLTGVLDWEFSGITPIDQWIRRNTFQGFSQDMINGAAKWKQRLADEIIAKDPEASKNLQIAPVKDKLLSLISLTFWIVHCTVTDTQADDRKAWIQRFNNTLADYKVIVQELK
ncbi:phosphotransferase enzyme family-domain-containing protein [Umbelopsis sp. PMI_123]|nr:phosphotransferase enzyme family-domain-containing protein [Umbelopsis sp. PMI_123]